MDALFKAFDAWHDIHKARKAKGLDNWAKLSHLADRLAGKGSKHISFTCGHPTHGGVAETHNLGSNLGNLHFLLGYGNPGFYLAPYHWQIIYPDLDEKEVASFAAQHKHPSQPILWEKSGLDVSVEGDQEDGAPHPYAHTARMSAEQKARSISTKFGYHSYKADPVLGTVTEAITEKVYKWDLIQNSFFAYANPKIVEAMDAAKAINDKPVVPEAVLQQVSKGAWDPGVYPLVKSLFPKPGSIVTINTGTEVVYGLIKSNLIELVDSAGNQVEVEQYDRAYKSLDLLQDGDMHPSMLYNFATRYLGIDVERLKDLTKSVNKEDETNFASVVYGLPSRGYDDVPPDPADLKKSVSIKDHTFRLVVGA